LKVLKIEPNFTLTNLLKANKYWPETSLFFLCAVYWIYLIKSSAMQISCDAIGFELAGKNLYEKGWVHFFVNGPQREPIYPFLISLSMRFANFIHMNYQTIQATLQMLILFIAQIFTLVILKRLGVHRILGILVGLYIGISPAIINSTLSLFSEVVTYPLVLGVVVSAVYAWKCIREKTLKHISIAGLITSSFFVSLIFAKVAYYYAFFIFHASFLLLLMVSDKNQMKMIFRKTVFYIFISATFMHFLVVPYKLLNLKYNGNYEFTDRGARHFWICAYARTQPHSARALLARLAAVPGDNVCRKFFSASECLDVSFLGSDHLRDIDYVKLMDGNPAFVRNELFMSAAFELVSQKPVQYTVLYVIEGLRTFFWETSRLGFVSYASWLQALYDSEFFNSMLRLIISVLSIVAFILIVFQMVKIFLSGLGINPPIDQRILFSYFLIAMVVSHIAIYALTNIVTRYSLHVAPLFLISIALTSDGILFGKAKAVISNYETTANVQICSK